MSTKESLETLKLIATRRFRKKEKIAIGEPFRLNKKKTIGRTNTHSSRNSMIQLRKCQLSVKNSYSVKAVTSIVISMIYRQNNCLLVMKIQPFAKNRVKIIMTSTKRESVNFRLNQQDVLASIKNSLDLHSCHSIYRCT